MHRHSLSLITRLRRGAAGLLGPAFALAACLPGCTSAPRTDDATATTINPRTLPMFSARASDGAVVGAAVAWEALVERAGGYDVVIIGEQHDDAVGHAVQRALVEDLAARHASLALSMEMLERDDQMLVRDYMEGLIDAKAFEQLTNSTNWGGEGQWAAWYQPIIDAANARSCAIIGANAPRRYVRLARSRGFDFLDGLSADRRALFELPALSDHGAYYMRFREVMSPPPPPTKGTPGASPHGTAPAPPAAARASDDSSASDKPDPIKEGFRSQLIWDATMADSIADALAAGHRPVVHLIGQFHSDFDGGTVMELRARAPEARIFLISMQRRDDSCLAAEDTDRADVVIHTGARPPDDED